MTVDLRVVGGVRKAFGLKGELLVHPITSEPGAVFAPGSVLYGNDESKAWTVESARPFKDAWLVKVAGINDKTAADAMRGVQLSALTSQLAAPSENEVYLDELTGMSVRDEPHGALGIVANYYELPQGLVLEVRGEKWKADIPFNDAFLVSVDRKLREITVTLPDGLLELQSPRASGLTPRTQPQAEELGPLT